MAVVRIWPSATAFAKAQALKEGVTLSTFISQLLLDYQAGLDFSNPTKAPKEPSHD